MDDCNLRDICLALLKIKDNNFLTETILLSPWGNSLPGLAQKDGGAESRGRAGGCAGELPPAPRNAFGANRLSSAEPKATTEKTSWGKKVNVEG